MNLIQALRTQLAAAWQRYDARQRMTLLMALLVAMAAIVGVGIWSARSEYVPLANQLGPAQAAELISRLQSAGIPYQLSYSGSELLVPKQDWNRARLAAGDMVDPLRSQPLAVDDGLFADPSLNRYRLLRNQEDALARSVMRVKGVAGATVHISRPDPSPFLRDARPTTASVVLELRPGSGFDRQQAAAIVSMVAHAVEGLRPDDVTLVDTAGRILSEKHSAIGSDVAAQFDYQRRLEIELASKAETMLAQLLGPGRAVVRVAADVDFTQTTRREETYDPESKVKKRESITTENTTGHGGGGAGGTGGAGGVAGGGAGTASNVAPAAPPAPGGGQTSRSETIETEYLNTRIENTVTEAAGRIQRLTVSAAVDIPAPAGGGAALTKEQIESVIKQAVGFNVTRNDAIEVVVGPLAGLLDVGEPVASGTAPWRQYEGLVRNASLGVASLVVLVIALLTLRKVRPVVVTPVTEGGLSAEGARRLSTIARTIEEDPDAVAELLEDWLGEEQPAAETGRIRMAA